MNAIHALSQLSYSPTFFHTNNGFLACQYDIDRT
jgi:hypothetical protein